MKNRKLKTLLDCLIQGRIVESIQESNGWKNENEENIIYVIHCKIRNFFFDRAFHKLPIKYRIKLLSKFNHKRHFIEGVSKSFALEYYYLNRDAFEEDGMIRGLEGGSVNMTTEMRAYYHSIDETVLEIADNKALLKDLVYEVAKQLSNVFYVRLELISKELSLNCDVNDEIYVAAPIPYKEYKFGNHATVKCFEPEIAFGMEIYGVRDSLKPIDEYISDIKMFIDAYKRGFVENDDIQKSIETKQEIIKTPTIERMMCISMLDFDIKKLYDLGFFGQDIKQAIDYATEYLRLNKTKNIVQIINVSRFVAEGLSQQFPIIRDKYDDITEDTIGISGTIYGNEIDIVALQQYVASQYETTTLQDNEIEIAEQLKIVLNAIKTNRDIPFTIQWIS